MQNNDYATKDLYLASFLKLNGMPLIKLEKRDSEFGGRNPVWFIFDNPTTCYKLEEMFWSGKGDAVNVNLKEFVDTVRDMRTRTKSVQ